ncbi:nitrate reductase [Quisquiliibacterium transsilvanicum]|uniref:Assimilatory nitrate reductase catalytic subunit n=1 Tax=Quisquiliibacterium transsilvanicum TaxID=1549638 RepID=A0A7W8HHR1_9BURK|nr:nitrate reductase [Quisquiliibacterium transsilvanicum]MBB5272282.1 assimilatory nitrate reductase catalytic subunit [Quisquiliibacterium transsilvanicum]
MSTHETRSTCPYCGVGCGVLVESDGQRITGVRGDPEHPANFGRLCTKGSTLHLTASPRVATQARLLVPMRREHRGAAPAPLGWDDALDLAADTMHRVVGDHGPDAVGFYVSGQLLTEDYYVFNKLAKGLLGTNNVDTNSRLCMSSAVAGYKRTLGADAPPACYEDIDHADCLFIAGANPAWAHPVLYRRIEDARARRPGLRIVCCDPRRTETAAAADLHLQLQPGTDVMLFHGMLHLMIRECWTRPGFIAGHTVGFEALARTVADCTPERVSRTCGIPVEDLHAAARLFATSQATLSLWCQGLNQSSSGTAKNAALIGLHLATGQIGRPGAGPFSLTGQPNAMGGREVGGLANLLPAHRDLANPAHRAEVAALWGVPSVPERPGRTAVEMFQAAADGEIRMLWIACTNPAQSMPDQATVRRALERAEFVVLQEAFAGTATGRYADLLLPASAWGEKDGTVTNSERRISRVRAAVPPPGQARHDWAIVVGLARRLGGRLGRPGLFPFEDPESIWNEHRETTRGRDLDITGLDWAMIDRAGPQQWPLPEGATAGTARLYQDLVFATGDGRARFDDTAWRPPAEAPDAARPFALNTGRLRDQWHGMSRTGAVARLFDHAGEPAVQLHPQDMERLGIGDGTLVRVASARGALVLPARPAPELGASQAFIPMHWGDEFLGGRDADGTPLAGVNALSSPAFCPDSKQPELKHSAVSIERCELPWGLVALAWLPEERALTIRQALRETFDDFGFASCVPFSGGAGERIDVLLRAAAAEPADQAVLGRIEQLLELDGPAALRYADPRRGQRRALRLDGAGETARLEAFLLAGDTRASGWMGSMLRERLAVGGHARSLLAAHAEPPVPVQDRGRTVCTCHDVSDRAIRAHLDGHPGGTEERLRSLQQGLRCGTGCGACVPELKRLASGADGVPESARAQACA